MSKRPCSFKTVNPKTGKALHGTAAFLNIVSRQGGPDQYLLNWRDRVLRTALREEVEEARRPELRVV